MADASFWEIALPALGAGVITPITLDLIRLWKMKRMGVTKENIAQISSNKTLYDTLITRLAETEERLDERIKRCEELIYENGKLSIQIAERDVKIADRDAKIADRDQKIADRDLKLAERDVTIQALENRIEKLEEENARHTAPPIPVVVVGEAKS